MNKGSKNNNFKECSEEVEKIREYIKCLVEIDSYLGERNECEYQIITLISSLSYRQQVIWDSVKEE